MKPLPRLMRLSRRKIVTIAAGFKCVDGVVLCADSQETTGSGYKRSVAKIVLRPVMSPPGYSGPVAVFTGAGDATFIDELIEEMWESCKEAQTLTAAVRNIKSANHQYHRRIWQLYPCLYSTAELPDADILFSVRVGHEFGLYEFHSVKFREVSGFSSIGCGTDLADFLCDSIPDTTMEASNRAIYMLEKVKANVDACGGDSHIAILSGDGAPSTLTQRWISETSTHLSQTEQYLRELLFHTANLDNINDEDFQGMFDIFKDWIIEARQERRGREGKLKEAAEKIRKIKEAKKKETPDV